MMTIMVGVSVMVGLAIVATSILWVPAILDAFAKKNFIVTQIREGTSKVIVIFGKFHHAALSYIGHYFNREYDLINEAERDEYTARLEAAKTGLSNGDKEPAKSLLIGKGWLIDEAKARESIANVEAAQTSLSDGDDGPARTLLMEKGRLE